MQDIKELNADLENTDPVHLKVSPSRKEPVPATQSSPTRLPLTQIHGNLSNASAKLLPVLQNKAHGEDDQQSKLDATSCEVGPNARRWAAQHRSGASIIPGSGTVVFRENARDQQKDAAWNVWLEKGDTSYRLSSTDQGVDEMVSVQVPNDSCTEFAKECSPAVSSPGSWVPDVHVPVENIQHAEPAVPFAASNMEPLEDMGSIDGHHKPVSTQASGGVPAMLPSPADLERASSIHSKSRSSAGQCKVQGDLPACNHFDLEKERSVQTDLESGLDEEQQDRVTELRRGHSRVASHHRRNSSMVGGPVYLQSSHRAKIPSADIGALQLHEYFSPLSLGRTVSCPSANQRPAVLEASLSDATRNDGHKWPDREQNMELHPYLSQQTHQHVRADAGLDSPESSRATDLQQASSAGNTALAEDVINTEQTQNERTTFTSRPYRPLSAEGQPAPTVRLPDSPDPFSKTMHLPTEGSQSSSEHEQFAALPNALCSASKDQPRLSLYTDSHSRPQVCSPVFTHQLAQPNPDTSSSRKPAFLTRISRLADSCVGRFPPTNQMDKQESFTPLSDSISAAAWREQTAKKFNQIPIPEWRDAAGTSSTTACDEPHAKVAGMSVEINAGSGKEHATTAEPRNWKILAQHLGEHSEDKSHHTRAGSVLSLETRLAEAGVTFNKGTQDDVIRLVHSSLQHKLW